RVPGADADPEGAGRGIVRPPAAAAGADRIGADRAAGPGVVRGSGLPARENALLELPVLHAVLGVLDRPAERLDPVARRVGGLEVLPLARLEALGGEPDDLVGRLLLLRRAEDPEDVADLLEQVDRLGRLLAAEALVDRLVALVAERLEDADGAGDVEIVVHARLEIVADLVEVDRALPAGLLRGVLQAAAELDQVAERLAGVLEGLPREVGPLAVPRADQRVPDLLGRVALGDHVLDEDHVPGSWRSSGPP